MCNDIIKFLERKIKSCDEFGDMRKEKWAFQVTLKEVRKLQKQNECNHKYPDGTSAISDDAFASPYSRLKCDICGKYFSN